jgi:signal peptide peptidase SppA
MIEDHATLSREEFKAAREGTDFCGDAVDVPQAETVEGICYIPIGGPIGKGLGGFEKGAGCVDCADICDELDQMETDPNCRAAILVIDSPGGMVQGIAGVADKILACDKPVYAFTEGQMCSAAYWLACSCDAVFATEDADVGSIGAYCYLLDQSKRYADAGVKPVLVTSGKYKGMGAPGLSFTKDQLALLQERINDISEKFYSHVEEMRGNSNVSRDDMQGQVYAGAKAMAKGLIDDVVTCVEDVAALL